MKLLWWRRKKVSGVRRVLLEAFLEATCAKEEQWHRHIMNARSQRVLDFFVDQMLEVREDRAHLLRQLGRAEEARKLEKDIAMRREWVHRG